MLPYGALWKLDQALHPAAAPRARTPKLRRRRALLLFFLAAVFSLLFLLPYHGSHLRRVYTRLSREEAGTAVLMRDPVSVGLDFEVGLKQLRSWAGENGFRVVRTDTTAPPASAGAERDRRMQQEEMDSAVRHVFYYTPAEQLVLSEPAKLPIMVDCPVARHLAGAGAGTIWDPVQTGLP